MSPEEVGGQVAGLVPLPDVGLMVGPSGLGQRSSPNIEQTTRTDNGVHDVDSLAVDGSRDGEASSLKVGGSDNGGKGCLTANLTGASWGPVEASGRSWSFWDCKWVACQDVGKVRKFSVGKYQRLSWENFG